jgi:hypothetical protein
MNNRTRTYQFSVTLLIYTKNGLVWWPAEIDVPYNFTDEQALDHINTVLVEDGSIRCTKIKSDCGDGPRARIITGREPVIIGANALATITQLHFQLVEQGAGHDRG